MATVRVEKIKDYTIVNNHYLKNKNLSLKAIGLLTKMLSFPDDWDYSINGLYAICKEGKNSIRSTLKELEEHKYLVRNKLRDPSSQQFMYEYIIYEEPYDDFQYTEDTYTENKTQLNTKELNTNNKDKKHKTIHSITQELINRDFITENDLDLYKYNDLFIELLENYEYLNIIICCNYILSRWKLNHGLDENSTTIKDKFNYFKKALINNLNRQNIELDWLSKED